MESDALLILFCKILRAVEMLERAGKPVSPFADEMLSELDITHDLSSADYLRIGAKIDKATKG